MTVFINCRNIPTCTQLDTGHEILCIFHPCSNNHGVPEKLFLVSIFYFIFAGSQCLISCCQAAWRKNQPENFFEISCMKPYKQRAFFCKQRQREGIVCNLIYYNVGTKIEIKIQKGFKKDWKKI